MGKVLETSISQLLEEWSRVDPEICRKSGYFPYRYFVRYPNSDRWLAVNAETMIEAQWFTILAAITDCIIHIESLFEIILDETGYSAKVRLKGWTPTKRGIFNVGSSKNWYHPSAALLDAYLDHKRLCELTQS